jgi:hypothetical protein
MKQYKCIARERMTTTTPIIIEASSPKDAAYKIARQLGYQGKQTLQGRTYDYISKIGEFDGSVPCCVAVYNSNGSVNYYSVRG